MILSTILLFNSINNSTIFNKQNKYRVRFMVEIFIFFEREKKINFFSLFIKLSIQYSKNRENANVT
jgi:hypothetical protein